MLARVSQLNPALFIMSSLLSMTYLRFRQTLTYSTMIGVASDDPAQSELNTKHFYSTLQVRETGSNIIMLLLRHTAHYHDAHDQINSDEGEKQPVYLHVDKSFCSPHSTGVPCLYQCRCCLTPPSVC
jgi:hypothetical protein